MEWIPSNRRGFFATICQFFFTLAGIALSVGAFFLQDWRLIQIVLAVSNAAAVTYFWFAPEPLQWLMLNNQVDKARIIWRQIAEFNRVELSVEDVRELESFQYKKTEKTYSMLDCFRTPGIRRNTLLACFAWFATFMTYLGLSFVITDIAPNLYHNLIIGGVMELIPCALAAYLVAKYGPKYPLLSYFVSGGILAIIVAVIPASSYTASMAKNSLAILCRMCLLGCMSTVTFFTVELFPTVIRNSAYGLCAAAMHIGGMVSHELFFLENVSTFKGIPVLVLGVIALLGGLATFFLPQTNGKMTDTIEEAEEVALDMETMVKPPLLEFLRKRKVVTVAKPQPSTERIEFTSTSFN
ncbi:putative Solute carrier family 22 member 6-A [Hypsibius exemplaris]|uniref:Solute carrier family 22 member 6-A n=1 Tax=Hypsibius exemplaris TaxID=2072580 RepID=A0A1W0WBV8_HYPEX|nr:putative Solute carrier family 22 member 6-A [Hypsibius exemplaris]